VIVMAFAKGRGFVILNSMAEDGNPDAQRLLKNLKSMPQDEFDAEFTQLLGSSKGGGSAKGSPKGDAKKGDAPEKAAPKSNKKEVTQKLTEGIQSPDYEKKVKAYVKQGMTRQDAEDIVEGEMLSGEEPAAAPKGKTAQSPKQTKSAVDAIKENTPQETSELEKETDLLAADKYMAELQDPRFGGTEENSKQLRILGAFKQALKSGDADAAFEKIDAKYSAYGEDYKIFVNNMKKEMGYIEKDKRNKEPQATPKQPQVDDAPVSDEYKSYFEAFKKQGNPDTIARSMAFLTAHKDEYSARVEEIMETEGVDSSEAEDIAEGEITMGELNKFFKQEQTPQAAQSAATDEATTPTNNENQQIEALRQNLGGDALSIVERELKNYQQDKINNPKLTFRDYLERSLPNPRDPDYYDEEGQANQEKVYIEEALEVLDGQQATPQTTKSASTQAKTQKPSNPNLNKGEILYDDESIKTQPEEVQKAYQLGKETLSEENKNELESIINAWNNPTNNSEQIPFKDFLKGAVANSDYVRGGLNSRETEAFANQIDEIYKNLYGESARTNPQADTNVVPKRQGKPAKPSNPPLSQIDDQVKNAIAETNSGNLIYNNFLEDMNDNGIENPTVEDFKDYLAMTEDTSIEEYNNTGDEFLREQSTEARAIFDSLERTQKDIPTPQSITESQNAIRSLVNEYQSKDDIATDVFYRVGKAIDKDTDAQSAINKFRENFEKYYDPTDRHLTSLDELEQKLGLKNETQPQTKSVATNTEGNYKRDDAKFESNLAAYEKSLTNRPLQINGKPVDIRTFTETLKADMLKDKGFLNSNYMDEKEDGSTVEQIADDHVWDYLDYLTDNESEFIGDNEYGIGDQAQVSSSAQEALQKNKK
jgi:hypothetical protein